MLWQLSIVTHFNHQKRKTRRPLPIECDCVRSICTKSWGTGWVTGHIQIWLGDNSMYLVGPVQSFAGAGGGGFVKIDLWRTLLWAFYKRRRLLKRRWERFCDSEPFKIACTEIFLYTFWGNNTFKKKKKKEADEGQLRNFWLRCRPKYFPL